MVIFVDVDEVLADFTGAALAVHGITREELENKRTPGHWDIDEVLGIKPNDFWAPIHAKGEEFWGTLPRLPWALELIDFLLDKVGRDNVCLLTSPVRGRACYDGKERWIDYHFGTEFNRIITPHKHFMAGPQSVLIDDRERTIIKFRERLGYGIVFPTRGNGMHEFSSDPLQFVKAAFASLQTAMAHSI